MNDLKSAYKIVHRGFMDENAEDEIDNWQVFQSWEV